jgi:hypothetical protein
MNLHSAQRVPGVGSFKGASIFPRFAAVVAIALLVAGCATEVGQHTFLKQAYPARPADSPVDVYTNGLPTRPFERVAILDVQCESQGYMTPSLQQDGLPVLIKQARAAGCDAVIEIEEVKSPENWTLETKVKHFTGIGIIYK